MSDTEFNPYVPPDTDLQEFTFKALLVGVVLACILGAANAYLGMKAGLTVAATFPAAVVAMAILRPFRGTVLEENIARTTASVGEALVAGAIFTIPAFVISGVWDELKYFESTAIMLIGGVLGVLFVVMLRRTLVEEADLPFPESVACAEIVKAGQGGQTGAQYVFGAFGLAAVWELFKNVNGFQVMTEHVGRFFAFARSEINLGIATQSQATSYGGGIFLESPSASPALMGVGYIIGARLAAIVFAGGCMGWLVLVPLALFLNPGLETMVNGDVDWVTLSGAVWRTQVRPLAVGAMIVAAFYTLYNLRSSLIEGIGKAVRDMRTAKDAAVNTNRLERDIPFKGVVGAILVMIVPLIILYYYFSRSVEGSIISAIIMAIAGFLFAAVAGYLVGLIGSSNNPISGLTLSTLIIAALLMVMIGLTGNPGIAAVLGVAGVVCCSAGIAGDMMQDLKVGHILGGTPAKMEWGEIIGVIVAAFVLVYPLWVLDKTIGIGGAELPAPQAGLMALMAKGIVGGKMPWALVIIGMLFALFLILVNAPAPMLIAVGMYLPFHSTAAIFAGGVIRWIFDVILRARKVSDAERDAKVNVGILLSSGLIAGEALTAVILAFLVLFEVKLPTISQNPYVAFLIYPLMLIVLVWIPLRSKGTAAVHISH